MPERRYLGISVLDAARQRIAWAFETCPKVYVSYSGGKDSTVMLHLVMQEAEKRNRKVGVLFVDLEGQYTLTIGHVQECFDRYKDLIEPYWISLPIHLRNAVSQFETHWICWEPDKRDVWIRQPPKIAITDQDYFPFYSYAMEFEEFVPAFGHWYAQGKLCACFVGIRTSESLNRWRTIAGHGVKFNDEGKRLTWTNWIGQTLWNVYPIYDWATEDIWTFHAKYPELPYNHLYDLMYKAGLTIHQARICQPYGDDQRKGLWLFHLIEPDTWSRVVARVNGANSGALYAQESGNILGRLKITKPEGHTWQSFAMLLLESLPPRTREHFENKIAVFLYWWKVHGPDHGFDCRDGIPDEMDPKLESGTGGQRRPSWRRICKVLLRHDYWCHGLSFSAHKSQAYERYLKVMKNRKRQWGIFP